MTTPAAVSGDYVDLRFVKSRKVAQVVIEIPIELAAGFVATFGTPNPATGVPVALARLDMNADQKPKDKKRFNELPRSQQAALRCNEPDFQRFMGARTPEEAAQNVRIACRVASRSELNDNTKAAQTWEEIEAEYFAKQRGMR